MPPFHQMLGETPSVDSVNKAKLVAHRLALTYGIDASKYRESLIEMQK